MTRVMVMSGGDNDGDGVVVMTMVMVMSGGDSREHQARAVRAVVAMGLRRNR